ncbi:MAG: class I SAM-dependent methyltransferase [Acidimicrobiales bacterium]
MFEGLANNYDRSRHDYPSAFRDHLVAVGALTPSSRVVDLGAGTGQLALLASSVASTVLAIDPEPDMVRVGQQITSGSAGVRWSLGADRDLAHLVSGRVDLVLIGNAFHFMDQPTLLHDLDRIMASDGVVVVCSSSIPVWLQQTDWSRALRSQLSAELNRAVSTSGAPDHDSDLAVLHASPFPIVDIWTHRFEHRRAVESVVGEVVSSTSGQIDRVAAARISVALRPYSVDDTLPETVVTTALVARRRAQKA